MKCNDLIPVSLVITYSCKDQDSGQYLSTVYQVTLHNIFILISQKLRVNNSTLKVGQIHYTKWGEKNIRTLVK